MPRRKKATKKAIGSTKGGKAQKEVTTVNGIEIPPKPENVGEDCRLVWVCDNPKKK